MQQQQYGLNRAVAYSFAATLLGRLVGSNPLFSCRQEVSLALRSLLQAKNQGIAVQKSAIRRCALLLSCLSIGAALPIAVPTQAAASSKSTRSNTAAIPYSPPVPPNLGAPKGRTGGGASRGTCTQAQAMRAVLPRDLNRAYDLTVAERPTFWFYLPDRPYPETQVEFVLQDAEDRYVYKTTFTQPNTSAGLISLTVPQQSAPLASGAVYNWTLSVQCSPNHPSQVSFVRGAIQKVAVIAPVLSPAAAAAAATFMPSDYTVAAQLYAQQGYWADALTLLAQALQAQPLNPSATQLWKDLLSRSGLTHLQPPPPSPSIAIRRSKLFETSPTAIIP
jgi:hypothetical protein